MSHFSDDMSLVNVDLNDNFRLDNVNFHADDLESNIHINFMI